MAGLIVTVAQQKGGAARRRSPRIWPSPTWSAAIPSRCSMSIRRAVSASGSNAGSGVWARSATGLEFRTASGWGARREAQSLARDHDVVIVDTPPKSDIELRPAIEVASLAVVPVQPTPVDLWATEPTLAMIAREGSRSLLVLNRVVARALITTEAVEAVGQARPSRRPCVLRQPRCLCGVDRRGQYGAGNRARRPGRRRGQGGRPRSRQARGGLSAVARLPCAPCRAGDLRFAGFRPS